MPAKKLFQKCQVFQKGYNPPRKVQGKIASLHIPMKRLFSLYVISVFTVGRGPTPPVVIEANSRPLTKPISGV